MAEITSQSAHRGFYGGTHGNMATAVGGCSAPMAINDVVVVGTLPAGLAIKKVGAGCASASADSTVDISMRTKAGTVTVLAAALSVNATFSVKDIFPVSVGFEEVEILATVKGGAIAVPLAVTIEYLTVGTM
ncbi:MAG: hypothetical protein ACRCUH_15135 [Shewanella sp.]